MRFVPYACALRPSFFALCSSQDRAADALKDGDKLIRTYDENEDSVYSVAWSAADAWIFAALSYDGRVVAHHVPPPEKYKILL
jgi:hypothetical protein